MVVLYVFGVIVVIDVMVWLSRWMEQRCQSAFSLSDVVIPWNLTFVFLFMSVDVIWVPTHRTSMRCFGVVKIEYLLGSRSLNVLLWGSQNSVSTRFTKPYCLTCRVLSLLLSAGVDLRTHPPIKGCVN